MVTKLRYEMRHSIACFVLAKKLMVTKRQSKTWSMSKGFVLAKKLMVTKLVNQFSF